MKKGQGKQKGNDFEIQICRKLTKWVTGKERPEIFWRSASSGAKATMSKKSGHATKMHGDVMAIDQMGTFLTDNILIECKHYKDVRVEALLERKGLVFGWLHKCMTEAEESGKYPWLVFKGNYGPLLIILERYMFGHLEDIIGTPRWYPLQYQNVVICRFDWFLEWVRVEAFEMMFNRGQNGTV